MRRLLLFLGIVAAGLLSVAALNWWVDPLGEFYEDGLVAEAQRSDPPCLIALDLLGDRSWPAFKEDLARRRAARTIVIGTSRVLKLSERNGERGFVNGGMPGTGPADLVKLLRRLRMVADDRVTVLLGVEIFWFNRTWTPGLALDRDAGDTTTRLLSGDTALESLGLVRRHPGVLVAAHRRTIASGGRCVLERADRVERGTVNAWEVDGSFEYAFEFVPGAPAPTPDDEFKRDLVRFDGSYYRNWTRLDARRLADLERALALARSWGWTVVGFVPPYAPRWVERLATAPETAARWRELGVVLPAIFRRHGFAFAQLRDVRDVPCPPDAFADGGWHMNDACAMRVRDVLDAAAVTVAP